MKNTNAKWKYDIAPVHVVGTVEAYLFEKTSPVKTDKISDFLGYPEWAVEDAVERIKARYENKEIGLEIFQNIERSERRQTVLESRGNRPGTIDNYRINLNRFLKFLGKPFDIEHSYRKVFH